MKFSETLLHRWLAIPYILHAKVRPGVSKKAPTVLFIHGIGNSGAVWNEIIATLPKDIRLITIDLLGFGESKRPAWAVYSARTQARSVMATFLKLRMRGPVTIVGHSLGALVAVEIAKKYPLLVRSLILCSPPFYQVDETKRRLLPSSDTILREMYIMAKNHPEQFMKLSVLAQKLGLVNNSFSLSRDDAPTYMSALESTIINQTSLHDAAKLTVPTHIIYGRLDPVVVSRNLRDVARQNPRISLTSVLASHEIKGNFVKGLTDTIINVVLEGKDSTEGE